MSSMERSFLQSRQAFGFDLAQPDVENVRDDLAAPGTPGSASALTADALSSLVGSTGLFNLPALQMHELQQQYSAAPVAARTPSAHTPVGGDIAASSPTFRQQPFATAFYPQRLPPALTVSFTENKKISKSPNWTYSPILEKLFCKNVSPVTFNLRTSELIPPGSQLLAAAWTDGVIVGRCPNHQVNRAEEVQLFDTDPSRFIVAENSCYLKKEDGAEYISLPIGDGMSCNFSVILYFMCFSSCLKLQRGKELRLQLKIENNGREICRTAVQMRVCACPGRDRNTLEGKQQAGDGEEQGGSSPPTPLNVGKRSFSDVAADDTDADIIRHQIFIEGTGPAVKQCIARLVDEAKATGARIGGAEMKWYTDSSSAAASSSARLTSTSEPATKMQRKDGW